VEKAGNNMNIFQHIHDDKTSFRSKVLGLGSIAIFLVVLLFGVDIYRQKTARQIIETDAKRQAMLCWLKSFNTHEYSQAYAKAIKPIPLNKLPEAHIANTALFKAHKIQILSITNKPIETVVKGLVGHSESTVTLSGSWESTYNALKNLGGQYLTTIKKLKMTADDKSENITTVLTYVIYFEGV
jgi:hypothetical protein